MNQATSQVLSNLIPRHSGTLPPELLALTSSLISQSRLRCSLSQEQEIGRTYACANLACERLKTTLNLPKIEPRPPLPPRVYKKLYAYIEDTLASTTPKKRARVEGSGIESGNATPSRQSSKKRTPGHNDTPIKTTLPQRGTPSKSKSLASFRTPKKGLRYEKRDETKIPRWVGVIGRELCAKLGMKEATPHVLAGVESLIFWEEEKMRKGEEIMGRWPAMMMAVWSIVWGKLRTGEEVLSDEEFKEKRLETLQVLRLARGDEEVERKVGSGGWEGWDLPEEDEDEEEERSNAKDVNGWMAEICNKGCLEMDWYQNMVRPDGSDDTEDDQEREDALDEIQRVRVREDEMRYGLGTMRQAKVDYLTEKKRAEYKAWKRNILAKIARLQKEGKKGHVMDIEA
ncbi:putative origin recognition complex subunit 6 protein [Botrytis fragariae]|uniref:Putative origin recognition complex subunit 6 protein n=1 Tax=Botrytis fragariae TaxID=1964551 RepID=A0A8H6EFH3_9HELO|nr:putative origin recognition complex subunit 6 protein [Botrytis fragariae]KAF5870449.1 putative origin recognition complex subunit 6 protein [Botrytis fragariae]